MKKLLLSGVMSLALSGFAMTQTAQAETVKIGVLLGFTGPIESLAPDMASGAELAFHEISQSGLFLNGKTIEIARGDSTCVDASAATAAAERLVTSDKVSAIIGAACSGVTRAVANNVAIPNGVPIISPSATSPSLTTLDDKGYFFRTAPSDARQGEVLADIVSARDIDSVAITYTNNDYGKGLAESFTAAFEAKGGTVEITAAHEDGKADYSAEVGALSASGAETLMVFGYVDQGGKGIIQAAVDTGAFENFFGPDGMVGDTIIDAIGSDIDGFVTTVPASTGAGMQIYVDSAKKNGFDGTGPFSAQTYDAAAILALAIQAGGSADRATIQQNILNVANAPGEKINPGELDKALKILKEGGQVDYQGATGVELSDIGETPGLYKEQEIKNGKYETVKYH